MLWEARVSEMRRLNLLDAVTQARSSLCPRKVVQGTSICSADTRSRVVVVRSKVEGVRSLTGLPFPKLACSRSAPSLVCSSPSPVVQPVDLGGRELQGPTYRPHSSFSVRFRDWQGLCVRHVPLVDFCEELHPEDAGYSRLPHST